MLQPQSFAERVSSPRQRFAEVFEALSKPERRAKAIIRKSEQADKLAKMRLESAS